MGTSAAELRSELEVKRADISHDIESIEDRVRPGRIVHRQQAAAKQQLGSLRQKVMGARDAATDSVHNATASVGGAMHATGDSARTSAQGNPLAAGLIAFGAGLLVSSLLPATRAEQQAATKVQGALEDAAATVGEASQDLVDELRPMVSQAAGEVTDHAKDSVAAIKSETTAAP